MKSIRTFAAFSGLALGAVAAHAETLIIDVPFAFSAGGKALPAGSYTLETAGNTLSMRGLAGGSMMLMFPEKALAPSTKLEAAFTESPGGNVLSSVTTPNGVVYVVKEAKRSAATALSPPAGSVLSKRP